MCISTITKQIKIDSLPLSLDIINLNENYNVTTEFVDLIGSKDGETGLGDDGIIIKTVAHNLILTGADNPSFQP